METVFETERLTVRKFRKEDAVPLYENHMDNEVREWFPNECYADPEEAREAIRYFADCVDQGRLPYVLAAELKGTGELIGDAGLSEVEGKPGETEIGYCIGQKYRRRGYATELVHAMSAFAASRFGIGAVFGRVVRGNAASARVLEHCGYQFVAEECGAEDAPLGRGMQVYRKALPRPD